MQMSYVEWVCPECKTKNRESCNSWMYGSPIRECKACRSEYLDRRWREVAIDGFDPRSNNSSFFLKGALVLLAIAAICGALIWFQSGGGGYSMKILLVGVFSALGVLFCMFNFLRIKLGFQSKDDDKFMAESKARLSDSLYVEKLRKYGYKV